MILTIGHSNLDWPAFLAHLKKFHVGTLVDVRSVPYSRWYPHFGKERLERELAPIKYLFLGEKLGGRPAIGAADYEVMAQLSSFKEGIEEVLVREKDFPALLCSEGDPINCHRALLVSRALKQRGAKIVHILRDGASLSHEQLEERLLENKKLGADLFEGEGDRLSRAYRLQNEKVGFKGAPG